MKTYHELIVHERLIDPRRNGIAERALRRIKEGTSAVLLQSGLAKNGGLILWNAIAICEMFKTSWQTGKTLAKGDSENHLKAQLFRLVQWLFIRFLQDTSQGSTNMVTKFYLEYSSDMC